MKDQQRFLKAMILSGMVLVIWTIFFAPDPPDPTLEDEVVAEETDDAVDQTVDGSEPDREVAEADVLEPDESIPSLEPDDEPVEAPEIETRIDRISTPFMDVVLDNRGAVVRDIQVTSPRQFAGVGGELMRAFEDDAPAWPFEVVFLDQTVEIDQGQPFQVIEEESRRAADGESYEMITYRHEDPRGRFSLDKTFTMDERRYVLRLDITLTNHLEELRLVDTPALDMIGRDDPDKETFFLDFRPDVLGAICRTVDDTERINFERIEAPITHSQHQVMWAGTDTRYFIMATIPDNGAEACVFEQAGSDYLRTRMIFERFSVEPKGTWSTSHSIFMGPKDFGVLRDTGSRLEEAVDYGFFTVLARPLRAALAFFYGFVGNWGLAIILLTLVIKLFTWPLTQKAYVNAERMKKLQPRIKEIREKYENDQQRMSEETMKLMREEKVNPLGCLPLLIQMPILYGLFIMIYNSVELYHAEFLWYADLSAPDPIFLLPLLMGGVMFVQQRLTMQASAATMNPQMMTVMKIMPVMFTAFMIFLPAGLVLYYLLNLVLGVLQQFLIRRKFQKAEEAGEPTP